MAVDERLLGTLKRDVERFVTVFREASAAVLDQYVSEYPIFVAHHQDITLGIPIIDRESVKSEWSFHLSSLEEFVTKGIIARDRLEEFKKIFKNPNHFICFFVLDQEGANFIFHPYPQT